ncbi:hypothetical protein CLV28_2115 [Sediminihabitans luteus]|uniref:Lipoprotein n=2 Tax=Sediminihabitans luteus TaxID=1138585 RepID=A0A2M9CED2_9CELL|nr:hypothetical protein CLV28_2115 [Sediminihabitans luteus]
MAKAVPVALAVSLLTAACGSSSAPADGNGAAGAGDTHEHGDYSQEGRVPVGSLDVFAADYWTVLKGSEGVTTVRAGGCEADAPCASFDILEGAALEGVDPAAAYLPDDAVCPGTEGFPVGEATKGKETEVEVGGKPATLTVYSVDCVVSDGAPERTVSQNQWYVPEGPNGPVLVVDRWSFEGLKDRLATAEWSGADA